MLKKIKKLKNIIHDYIDLKRGKTFNCYSYFHDQYSYQRLIKHMFGRYKDSSTFHRNIIAALNKHSRKKYSFEPNQEWIQAKKEYEEYLEMEGCIVSYESIVEKFESGEDVYVTKFRGGGAQPGDRWAEYHHGTGGIFSTPHISKLREAEPNGSRWIYLTAVDEEKYGAIHDDDFTTYRYATEEEIQKFHEDKVNFEKVTKEIDELNKDYNTKRDALYKKRREIYTNNYC